MLRCSIEDNRSVYRKFSKELKEDRKGCKAVVIGRYSKRRLPDIFSQKGDEGEETLIRRGLKKLSRPCLAD